MLSECRVTGLYQAHGEAKSDASFDCDSHD